MTPFQRKKWNLEQQGFSKATAARLQAKSEKLMAEAEKLAAQAAICRKQAKCDHNMVHKLSAGAMGGLDEDVCTKCGYTYQY